MDALRGGRPGEGFSRTLAFGFAGVEIIRRLLGVAQLPLAADLGTKQRWLALAREMVLAA
jgi:5-methylthioribose kinase